MPTRTRGNSTLTTLGGLVAPSVRVKAIEDEIKQTVESRMRERLGVPPRQALPDEVQALVASAAATAAQRSIELGVSRDVEEIAADISRGSLLNRFDAKVDLARKGLDHIVASDDVHQIMKRRADMLAAKKEALETAGFSSQEAMDILLADIAARGH